MSKQAALTLTVVSAAVSLAASIASYVYLKGT